jgi:hypothetical protein
MKLLPLSLALLFASGSAVADDSIMFTRDVSSSPGVDFVVEPEGEHAYMSFMNFYVPAQLANGELTEIEYYNIDDSLVKTEEFAKPLINVYLFGPVITFDDFSQSGFPGHGRRDAYAAVSLDDGGTWKSTNLSDSADESSYEIPAPGIQDPAEPTVSVLTDCEEGDTFCLTAAAWTEFAGPRGGLYVEGFSDTSQARIEIINGVTGDHVAYIRSKSDGTIITTRDRFIADEDAPCSIQAVYDEESSNTIAVEDAPAGCVGPTDVPNLITAYPGDVTGIFHGHTGNRILVAWQSKMCNGGFPAWSAEYDVDTVAEYLGIDNEVDLYLVDVFGVAGSQGSHDYTEDEEFDGEYDGVGVVPFSCLWSARGELREDPENEGTTEMVWFQAERLTSGRRDVNRIETSCVAGAGCAVSWQEDPEGLRPGEGEGAGTGWAGATTNSQTDIWYSFIEWEDFSIVDINGDFVPLADNIMDTGRPMPAVPMMVPARLTNNAKCPYPVTNRGDYCEEDFAGVYGIKNQCVGQVSIPLGPNGELQPICVVDANDDDVMDFGDLPNVANTAASRPRLNLQPRDSDLDGVTDDAWVVIIHEEDKGLGRYGFLNDVAWDGNIDDVGTPCGDPDVDKEDNCIEADIGKNQWYISFALGTPQTSVLDDEAAVDVEFSMLSNLVAQQNQYNAPEVNWITGTYYPPMSTADMWDFGELNFVIFNNEIARRASLMSQPPKKAMDTDYGLVAMPLFKEGIINQGGPADIMARRIVLDRPNPNAHGGAGSWMIDYGDGARRVTEADANPFDFRNLACEAYDGEGNWVEGRWEFLDGEDPYYPLGLCLTATMNLSARTPYTCEETGDSDGVCPGAADMTCEDSDEFGQLCLSETDPEDNTLLDKLLTWYECPGWNGDSIGGVLSANTGSLPAACYNEPDSALLQSNRDDRSWYMPIDISKAHRGFLDGDYVNMMYAWSPNWKLNAVGRDRYELYMRRSFDGGVTFSTTPATFEASNDEIYSGEGTTTCETWRDGDTNDEHSHVCTVYAAEVPEQSRDVTQHVSMLDTTLDPRYTPAGGSPPIPMSDECPSWYLDENGACISDWLLFTPDVDTEDGDDPTDLINPSRSFVVFESGDNTTVAVGEAEPENLDYGRAEVFGDVYTVWTEIDTDYSTIDDCYPTNVHDDDRMLDWGMEGTGFCNEFDTLEGHQDDKSEEASLTASAYGDFLYAVWGQYTVDENGEEIEGDDVFRRVWYLDDYISEDNAYTLPGTQQVGTPDPDNGG